MTRDEIIRMAREVADKNKVDPYHAGEPPFIVLTDEELERFAALVAAHEREACAKVCEGLRHIEGQFVANEFAREIRARGQE